MKNNSNNKDSSPYIIAMKETIRSFKDYNLDGKDGDREYNKEQFSPLSGYESKYEPERWNNNEVQYNHNCYAYVLNTIASKRKGKPQPGYFSGFGPLADKDYSCLEFYNRLKKDIPSMYLASFDEKCKRGFYKGFIAIDDNNSGGNSTDYHFYKMDKSGYWSHKPGRNPATNLDASGRKIINPSLADRKYEYFNYSKPCFFFCLNNKLARSRSSPNTY